MSDTPTTDTQPETVDPDPATVPGDTPVEEPGIASGAWPTAPLDPAVPAHPDQPGNRLRIRTNVSIFGLPALEEAEVFDIAEVRYAADQGLVEIIE